MFEKDIWIAKRTNVETDENGNEIEYFAKPEFYRLNYQPVSGNTILKEYGEDINDIYRAFVDRLSFQGKINVGDRAYLSDGEVAEWDLESIAQNDNVYCSNANYKVIIVLPQNIKTRIDFQKI